MPQVVRAASTGPPVLRGPELAAHIRRVIRPLGTKADIEADIAAVVPTQPHLSSGQLTELATQLRWAWPTAGDDTAARTAAAALLRHRRARDAVALALLGTPLLPRDLTGGPVSQVSLTGRPHQCAVRLVLEAHRHPFAGALAEILADYRGGVRQTPSTTLLTTRARAIRSAARTHRLDVADVVAAMVRLGPSWEAPSLDLLPTAVAVLTGHQPPAT